MTPTPEDIDIAIIGAGPAGLMAAEVLCAAGHKPVLFDAMPTPARKFLMAGKSGLNITHAEPFETFLTRFGDQQANVAPALGEFRPEEVQKWCAKLGVTVFTGSSGRVFPINMKASPLLRAWLQRLYSSGASLRTRHKWAGWDENGCHSFVTSADTPNGPLEGKATIRARASIFALGGVSWPKLGSDGSWQQAFAAKGVDIAPFRPANCGFDCQWSPHFRDRYAGVPIKGAVLCVGDGPSVKGDFVITKSGVEGSAVYGISAALRDALAASGEEAQSAVVTLDLTPDRSEARLAAALARPRGKKTFATHLKRTTGLAGAKAGLLRECVDGDIMASPDALAAAIKALPLRVTATRSIDEAISSAGGVRFCNLDEHLMIKALPGTFVAGEMLNWEAPTGGYLLTASMAQGKQAAKGVSQHLEGAP